MREREKKLGRRMTLMEACDFSELSRLEEEAEAAEWAQKQAAQR